MGVLCCGLVGLRKKGQIRRVFRFITCISIMYNLFVGAGCILALINQRSTNMIAGQSAVLQSAIDWLKALASCQFSLVVSVLSAFVVSHLSLLLTWLTADSN